MTFGETIRGARTERELTLEQLAKRVGTHKGYISGIENGTVNPPSVRFIKKFCKALGLAENEMILLAYVEKAPKEIADELRRLTGVR